MSRYHYIGKRVAALLLAMVLSVSVALAAQAIPLPTTPPEVDDTPVSHLPEPEGFREAEGVASSSSQSLTGVNQGLEAPLPPVATRQDGMSTGYAVLIGGVIWYAIMVIGVIGGRRGRRRD